MGYGPWGHKESDVTERLHVHLPGYDTKSTGKHREKRQTDLDGNF